jgi:pyruvate/2-oxoglutarate dehydrogenase complex dihydrolipoamide dehydrogenase (E3) component
MIKSVSPIKWVCYTVYMKYDYDVIVIGAGGGGLTAAFGAAGIGASVLLIEKDKLGGDCTHYGCIPSKTLIREAKKFYEAKHYTDLNPKNERTNYEILATLN